MTEDYQNQIKEYQRSAIEAHNEYCQLMLKVDVMRLLDKRVPEMPLDQALRALEAGTLDDLLREGEKGLAAIQVLKLIEAWEERATDKALEIEHASLNYE